MEHNIEKVVTADGIAWHVEYFRPSTGAAEQESLVLIPSGEGDCHNLTDLANILCKGYQYSVITFDNPGFSRTIAPLETYDRVTPQLMATQINALLKELQVEKASVFGCSSGGLAVLSLVALYPERVKCGIIHEVPFECPPLFTTWKELGDEDVAKICKDFFALRFTENEKKWNGLGVEYHTRLAKNYVTWVRHVVDICEDAGRRLATPENLIRRPVFWTVGSLNEDVEREQGLWKLDFEIARKAGLTIDKTTLDCLHFPSVSIPDVTARWIDKCIRQARGG